MLRMDDDGAQVREARRLAAEWRVKAAQATDETARKLMEQLATDYDILARTWLDIAQAKQRVAEH